MKVSVECEVGGRTLSLTTGEWAKQASGAVVVQYGETVLFVAGQTGPSRPGTDFFPLTVDYRERYAAAGKFAGGYLKREGRPTTKEILTCRLTDRPLRPLFPNGYRDEVQVMGNVLAFDGVNEPDVLTMTGGSAALLLAPVPFNGPIAGVRVGRIDGELVVMPTIEQMAESDLDLIVAGSKESVLMIEGFADQMPEPEMVEAIMFAHKTVAVLCDLQLEFAKKAGAETFEFEPPAANPFEGMLKEEAYDKLRKIKQIKSKQERYAATDQLKAELTERLFADGEDETKDGKTRGDLKEGLYQLEHRVIRDLILDGTRIDGRTHDELRSVSSTVSDLPKVHGSAVFTRGETQSLATITLGTARDAQRTDSLFGEFSSRFMLHYYFPSFSVGECRPIRGPGRREIGHGCLAERSVAPVIPTQEKFPYTIRIISDIMESNGSSSMASVCSATLALMDAGVPILQPVAGVSVGLVKTEGRHVILTDIMGDEDHHGDMDFKIAGTGKGITGIQLDLKIDGIDEGIIRETLDQAKAARKVLLRSMLKAIPRPRKDVSPDAPRLLQTKIDIEKIGLLIGPGGRTIRQLQTETGAEINIEDDGTVTVAGSNLESADAAMARIEAMTEDIKVGRIYAGTVSSVKDFGAFVEIAPGKDGLCHISELSDGFVKSVTDICKVGDKMEVKVIAVDEQNRVKLSRKAVLAENAKEDEGEADDDDDE